MPALNSLFVIAGCDATGIAKTQRSIADVIMIDLAAPIEHSERIASRRIVGAAIDASDNYRFMQFSPYFIYMGIRNHIGGSSLCSRVATPSWVSGSIHSLRSAAIGSTAVAR